MVNLSFIMIIFSAFNFASGEDIYRNQGIIMSLDLGQKFMVVNERIFIWDQLTIMSDEKGNAINVEKLKPNLKIYIEAVKEKKNTPMRIEKLYLLSKYIDKKERHR